MDRTAGYDGFSANQHDVHPHKLNRYCRSFPLVWPNNVRVLNVAVSCAVLLFFLYRGYPPGVISDVNLNGIPLILIFLHFRYLHLVHGHDIRSASRAGQAYAFQDVLCKSRLSASSLLATRQFRARAGGQKHRQQCCRCGRRSCSRMGTELFPARGGTT